MKDVKTSRDIDAETLRKWLEEGRPVTVLDVRPEAQRAEWAIPGSVHADLYGAIKTGDAGAVLDTHLHADHFSRSRTLAEKAGTSAQHLREGESLSLGTIRLQVLETPGHSPESKSYVLDGHAVFTGDTVFLDSVGRPDLIAGWDPKQRSELLYASIRRLARLSDSIWVLPAHVPVAPAFDGRPLAATLGELKARNKYLSASKADFMALLASGENTPPPNFETIMEANRSGTLPGGDWAALEAGPNRCARA